MQKQYGTENICTKAKVEKSPYVGQRNVLFI